MPKFLIVHGSVVTPGATLRVGDTIELDEAEAHRMGGADVFEPVPVALRVLPTREEYFASGYDPEAYDGFIEAHLAEGGWVAPAGWAPPAPPVEPDPAPAPEQAPAPSKKKK